MDISLIGVPVKYGADREGVQYAPQKLRDMGIVDVVRKYKKNVYDFGNLYIPQVPESEKYGSHKKIKYLKLIEEMNNNLAHLVYSALCSNSFPFIFGGDHSLGLGSISGASRFFDKLAVVWIDAHGDINTFETSPSGNSHGMVLGAALGEGHENLTNVYFEGQKIKAENTFIYGARDLDEGEVKLAEKLNLNLYTMDTIKKEGLDKTLEDIIEKLKESKVDGVHISFDIDSLDKKLVPGTGTPVDGGFTIDEVKKILKGLLQTKMIRSMDFVELNPKLDEKDLTAKLCIELIDWIFKHM